jgi:hypothetical protein
LAARELATGKLATGKLAAGMSLLTEPSLLWRRSLVGVSLRAAAAERVLLMLHEWPEPAKTCQALSLLLLLLLSKCKDIWLLQLLLLWLLLRLLLWLLRLLRLLLLLLLTATVLDRRRDDRGSDDATVLDLHLLLNLPLPLLQRYRLHLRPPEEVRTLAVRGQPWRAIVAAVRRARSAEPWWSQSSQPSTR